MAGPIPDTWVVDPGAASASEIAPGVWRLRLPWTWHGVAHVNAYLLSDGDEHLLIDTGPAAHPTCEQALERALAAAGASLDAVGRVLLTHGHSDHAAMAERIAHRSGAEVAAHRDTAHVDAVVAEPARYAALRRRRAHAEGVPEAALDWFADVREEADTIGFTIAGCAQQVLEPGVAVASPLGPLDVLATPGHAPSQVALHLRGRGLLFTGDTVCRVFSPYCDYGFTADPVGELLGSLDTLGALPPPTLAMPGHGGPIADLGAVVDDHRRGLHDGIARVRAAVEAAPGGAYDVAARTFGPADSAFRTFAITNLAAVYLRHLRVGGHVTRATTADGRFRYEAAR